MKTILNVKVDVEAKAKAKEIALEMGVPLSTIINAQLREFIRTREFSVKMEPELKPEVEKDLIRMVREYEKDPSVAYSFNSAKDAIKFLRGNQK